MSRLGRSRFGWGIAACGALRMTHVILLLAFSLGACSPAPDKPVADAPSQTDLALIKLEREGAAKPAAAAQRLLALYQAQAPGSVEALNALSLRGVMLGLAHDDAGVDAVVALLERWPDVRQRDLATVTARFVRARQLTAQHRLREAQQQLDGIDETMRRRAPPALRVRYLRALAGLKDLSGRTEDAIALYLQALALVEQSGQRWLQALCRADLSVAYLHATQPDQAVAMIDEATRLAELDPDPVTLNKIYTSRLIVYGDRADDPRARQAAEAAIRYARESGSRDDLALSLANSADVYLRTHDFAKAISVSEEALPLARAAGLRVAEIVALANIGMARIAMGQITEGKASVYQAVELDKARGAISSVGDTLGELGLNLERAGDLGGAADAYHQSRAILDEGLKQEDRKAILDAQEHFDSEHRAREMDLLNRQATIAAEQLRRGSLQMRLWTLLAGSSVVLGLLLIMLYQRVKRTNAALANSNALLKTQGEMDPLTGLANRRHFQLAVKRLTHDGKLRGTLFLIDIDYFKLINDRFGHASGDAVLVEVAQRLRQAVRAEDLVVRWGGEEFLILIESIAFDTVQLLAQRLLDLIGATGVSHADQCIRFSASIGFASFPLAPNELAVGWERAISLVDMVMYLAKAHGRNRAYGVTGVNVQDEAALDDLAQGMDAAWRAGHVSLTALQGPQLEREATV